MGKLELEPKMSTSGRPISFDETGIRVLDADKFDESKKMADECKLFVESDALAQSLSLILSAELTDFSDKVRSVVGAVDAQAQNIESEKMKASMRCSPPLTGS